MVTIKGGGMKKYFERPNRLEGEVHKSILLQKSLRPLAENSALYEVSANSQCYKFNEILAEMVSINLSRSGI